MNAKGTEFLQQTYGEWPLAGAPKAQNGNYLETDVMAARHGICGDPNVVDFDPIFTLSG